MPIILPEIENQLVPITFKNGITLTIKREDKTHPKVSGNKYRKLKYNILEAKKQKHTQLITFGGAYSNHIAATAAAGKIYGLKTIGVIRGEELSTKIEENPTLNYAKSCGMDFLFVNRSYFREKATDEFKKMLLDKFGNYYYVPEGGTNELAVRGCEEILTQEDTIFDTIALGCGTAGTISGIIRSSSSHQMILGFPALNGDFLSETIKQFTSKKNWQLISDYTLGGYAKITPEYIHFLNDFYKKTHIPLDPIYTGKMIYGLFHLIENEYFKPNSKILAIHTGGLQGILGINKLLQKQHREILHYENEIC